METDAEAHRWTYQETDPNWRSPQGPHHSTWEPQRGRQINYTSQNGQRHWRTQPTKSTNQDSQVFTQTEVTIMNLAWFVLCLLYKFWLLDGYFCVNTKSKNGGVWYFFLLLGPFSSYWVVSFCLVCRYVPSIIVSCYITGMPHIFWCKKEEEWIWKRREMVGKLGWVEGEESVVQI